jgi:hypothetical protein
MEHDYLVTVTMARDFTVKVKASDFDSAALIGEAYVRRHFLELEPDEAKPIVREVSTQEAE